MAHPQDLFAWLRESVPGARTAADWEAQLPMIVRSESTLMRVLRWGAKRGDLALVQWIAESQPERTAADVLSKLPVASHAANAGHLPVVEWALATVLPAELRQIRAGSVLTSAASGGHLSVVKWVTRTHLDPAQKRKLYAVAFHGAVLRGHLDVAAWIDCVAPQTVQGTRACELVAKVAGCGFLSTLAWVFDRYALPSRTLSAGVYPVLYRAAANGHLPILQWAAAEHAPAVEAELYAILHHAAANKDNLEMLEWLDSEFDLDPAIAENRYAFVYSCIDSWRRNKQMFEWLAQRIGLNAADVRADNHRALRRVVDWHDENLPAVEWLFDNLGLAAQDAAAVLEYYPSELYNANAPALTYLKARSNARVKRAE